MILTWNNILKKLFILILLIGNQFLFASQRRDDNQCSLAAEHLKKLQAKRENGAELDELIFASQNLRYFSKGNSCNRNEAASLELIASLYFDKGLIGEAIKYHLMAQKAFSRLNDPKEVAQIDNKLGVAYNFIGNQTNALKHLLQAEEALISMNLINSVEIADVFTNIASVYEEQNQNLNVKKYLFKALEIYKKRGDQLSIADVYNNFGALYFNKENNYELAKKYYLKSYFIKVKLGKSLSLAITAYNLGTLYALNQKNIEQAISFFETTRKISSDLNNDYYLGMSLQSLGDMYRLKKNYAESEKYLLMALDFQRNSGSITELTTCYSSLSKLYETKGNYRIALNFHHLSDKLKDSITNEQKTREFIALQKQFKLIKRDKKIQLLKRDKEISDLKIKKQRNYLIFGIIIFSIILLGTILYMKGRNKRNQINLEKRMALISMKALGNQLNSHFIANSLVSVKNFLLRKDVEKTLSLMDKFSLLMRDTLIFSRKNLITLSEDIKILATYLDIEQVNHSYNFHYNLDIDEGLNVDYIQLPPMLIQPFIENSIKHGIHHKLDGQIHIDYRLINKNELQIQIRDNGKGIELDNNLPKHLGEGTKIILERIAIFSQFKTKKDRISFTNEPGGGTIVTLNIPI
jgi:tetratricopeptide (TPR) repeat protein